MACRLPPNWSSWLPAMNDPLSLNWYVFVYRPCGWNVGSRCVSPDE